MATALNISYNDGTVQSFDFEHRNISEVKIEEIEKIDLQILQNGKPIIYKISNYWNLISITFNFNENLGIWDDLNTIKDVENIIGLTLYYRNGTEIDNFNVKIDPNIDFLFHGGNRLTSPITINFYESAEYKAAIEYDLFSRSI